VNYCFPHGSCPTTPPFLKEGAGFICAASKQQQTTSLQAERAVLCVLLAIHCSHFPRHEVARRLSTPTLGRHNRLATTLARLDRAFPHPRLSLRSRCSPALEPTACALRQRVCCFSARIRASHRHTISRNPASTVSFIGVGLQRQAGMHAWLPRRLSPCLHWSKAAHHHYPPTAFKESKTL